MLRISAGKCHSEMSLELAVTALHLIIRFANLQRIS